MTLSGARASRMAPALRALAPLAGLCFVLGLFLAIAPGHPPGLFDLRLVAVHAVLVATVGIGMTLVVISGGIDLSVGSTVALAGVVSALAARAGWPLAGVVIAAIAAGAACGCYNGLLIALLRLPPFIVTLGALGFFRGLSKWISAGSNIYAPTLGLDTFMRPDPPHPAWLVAPGAWLVVLLAAGAWVVLNRSVAGRQLAAMGDNPTAARYAAIPVARRRVQAYAACGALAGLAGALQFGRVTVGDPTISVGLELDVVAAVVIGGGSLAGGSGSIWGTVGGAVMMAFLRNRCTVLGWPNYVQEMIVGHIIIAAVALDLHSRRRAGGLAP